MTGGGAVEFADVSFALPTGRSLLQNISFRCEPGTTTALLGRSGSGKTTLLRTVNGLVRPTTGTVRVDGELVGASASALLALRRRIGYVIQETGLFPHMTVARNLQLPLEIAGQRHTLESSGQLASALERVGLEPDLLRRYPWQLSGGQRQRVGVARALITSPKVLLMDEPFGALDPLTRAEMQQMVYTLLREAGTLTLIVTHDLQEALFLADRVILMQDGRVAADVPVGEVRTSPNATLQAYVRATEPRPHEPARASANIPEPPRYAHPQEHA